MQGPLEVTIQELDGSFNHTFNIEENKTKFEITCHSKSRRYVDNLWFRPSSYCTTLVFFYFILLWRDADIIIYEEFNISDKILIEDKSNMSSCKMCKLKNSFLVLYQLVFKRLLS